VIVNNATLVSFWPNEPVVEGALIAIEGKSIVDFGKVGKLVDRYDHPDVLDVGGRLVLPGLVDAHVALGRSLTVGAPADASRDVLESALDAESLYWSAMAELVDAVRSGVTALFVAIPGGTGKEIDARLEALSRAFSEVGLRATLAHFPTPGSHAVRDEKAEAPRPATGAWMRSLVGLRVDDTLDDDAMRAALELSQEIEGRLHMVLGRGTAPFAKRLEQAGLLQRGGLVACRRPLTDEDEIVLRDHDVWVVHLGRAAVVGAFDTADLGRSVAARVKIALGTGGAGVGIVEEFRFSALNERALGRSLADGISLSFRAAFHGNPDLATSTFEREMGRVKPGASADLVVLDHRPASPVEAVNVAEHLFWGAPAPVHTVIVNGRPLYQNHRFVALDEERIRARCREAARKLWERM
jgi:cytosine/adenosine deaminase-related metal-dependent hydrolase